MRHGQHQRGLRRDLRQRGGAERAGCASPGSGRRQGSEGILRYTEAQSVATQRLVRIAPAFGLSDETYGKVMTANLRLLKKLGRA